VRLDLGACVADHDGVVLSFVRLRLALVAVCILVLGGSGAGRAHPDLVAGHRSFGVTVDNLGRLVAVLDSLRALPRRQWVRVVFDVDPNRLADPATYVEKVGAVRAAGDVLGELVDSSSIRRLSVTQTNARVAYTRALGSSVSMWEIGNEVNGDWTGAPAVVARKLQVGYRVVHGLGGHWALTLYENGGCGDGPRELSPVALLLRSPHPSALLRARRLPRVFRAVLTFPWAW